MDVGLGTTQIWGFSKCLNLSDYKSVLDSASVTPQASALSDSKSTLFNDPSTATNNSSNQTPYIILLIGPCDIRHIVKTVASRSKSDSPNRPLHFYILETQASIYARHMLLLSIICDPIDDIGIQERTELFLECYGNLMLREKTFNWLTKHSSDLIRVVTDSKGKLAEILDFSALKYRERDDLEFVFKFWRDSSRKFDAKALWEQRLRRYFGVRYDSRENAIDWDYHMKLLEAEKKAKIIYKPEYNRWRMNGTAFEIRDSLYNHPNRSMATVDHLMQNGVKVAKWGLFSDVIMGPFLAFGIECPSNPSMLKTQNDHHMHTSQEISEFNVKELFSDIIGIQSAQGDLKEKDEQQVKEDLKDKEVFEKIVELTDKEIEDLEKMELDNKGNEKHDVTQKPATSQDTIQNDDKTSNKMENVFKNVKISFLPTDPSETFVKHKKKYTNKFDAIFISSSLAHRVSDCSDLLKKSGDVTEISSQPFAIVECAKYLLDFKRDVKAQFNIKVDELASAAGLKRAFPVTPLPKPEESNDKSQSAESTDKSQSVSHHAYIDAQTEFLIFKQ